ncbi:MAG TPA: aminodeoxychorismate synthase component I, partial [Candidatus Polarisedimenticolia bacterium]|nr:aminodeoxychorismate synthase component I [Candidatus Polarisedimenticolia bacterium]
LEPGPVPVQEDVSGWVEPIDLLDRARGTRHPVLLHSSLTTHPGARFSIFACNPLCTLSIEGDRVTRQSESGERDDRTVSGNPDPFAALREIAPSRTISNAAGLPFLGGAIGYLGYPIRRSIEVLPGVAPDPAGLPDAWFGVYDAAVLFDHHEARVTLIASSVRGPDEPPAARIRRRFAALRRLLRQAAEPRGRAAPRGNGKARHALAATTLEEYVAKVRRALDYIAAGDIYQVNLSHRIVCPYEDDPVTLFRRLSERNPSPFAAFLDGGDFQIVSASPERFLSLRGDRARSAPIKGTRPRGRTSRSDERLARELLESEKDRAENVMIADLVRSDLGRVCSPGSVRVDGLCRLESFATLHHLVSNVTGRVLPGRDRLDVVRALFPGGSMTGAPKVRAMEVIDELEGEERGIYSGCLGYLSCDGTLDFNIVIRTLVCRDGIAQFRVGGGIVAESQPLAEYRESLDKARALLDVLRADLRTPGAG